MKYLIIIFFVVYAIVFASTFGLLEAGRYVGYKQGYKAAMTTGRCPHERMVNYDLALAETECMELRKQIERTKSSLAKSIEFMDQVKGKLGE